MCTNQQCMEKILKHLTKLICLSDHENIKDIVNLVDLSTSVSAQLLAVRDKEMGNWNEEM